MYTYTDYDGLRLLPDIVAIPLYILLEIWYILVAASGGPVAVAVGEHVSHSRAIAKNSPYATAFEVGLILTTLISLAGTLKRTANIKPGWRWIFPSTPKWLKKIGNRQRVLTSHREQTTSRWTANGSSSSSKRWKWHIEAPDFVFGSVILSSLVVLLLVLVMIAAVLATYIVFGVAVAALTTQLLNKEIPKWVLISAIPAAVHFYSGLIRNVRAPIAVVAWAIAGVIFAAMANHQGHKICSLGTGAAAGAATGTMYWAGRLPIHLINGTFHQVSQSWPRVEVTEHNHYARRLFPPLNDDNGAQTRLRNSETEKRVQKALMEESKELGLHPKMHKVFWSRRPGIDKVSHYVLLINGHKYELKDVSEARDRSSIHYGTDCVRYDMPINHSARVGDLYNRRVYELLLIGWTTFEHAEIDRICRQAGDKWKYTRIFHLGSNTGNCQHFLRKIAEEAIDKKYRAINWGWFRYDRMGPIQLAQRDAIEQAYNSQDREMDTFGHFSQF